MMRNEVRGMLAHRSEPQWQDEAQWKKLVVTHVENPCTFCAQDCQHKSTIQTVIEQVNFYGSRAPRLNTRPEKDKVYAARYHLDGNWYRCKVKSYAPGGAKVLYLDFGNTSTVTYNDIALLPPQLQWVPPLCQKYRLEGVKPAMAVLGETKHNEGKKWLMTFARGVVVSAYAYRKPKFYAWIADCWINDVNLSARVLSMGFALPNSEASAAPTKLRNGAPDYPMPKRVTGAKRVQSVTPKFAVRSKSPAGQKTQTTLQKKVKALEKEVKNLQATKVVPMVRQTLPLIGKAQKIVDNKEEDDVLLKATSMLNKPVEDTGSLSDLLKNVQSLEEKLNAAQNAIKQTKQKKELEDKITCRNGVRVEFYNKVTEYLAQGIELKERYDKLRETVDLIQKTYSYILSKASGETPVSDIDSAVDAYKKWKEEKIESLLDYHETTVSIRKDLCDNFRTMANVIESDTLDVENIPDVDTALFVLRDNVRKELKCLNPDKEIVGGLARAVKTGLQIQIDTISPLATSYEKYSTLALDMEKWLKKSPDVEQMRSLERTLRALRSRIRRKLVDLMDEKEEHGEAGGEEIKKDIGEMREELRAHSQEMEKQMEEMKYLINEHFPELPVLNSDLQFNNKVNWSEVEEDPPAGTKASSDDDDVQTQLAELKEKLERMTEEDDE